MDTQPQHALSFFLAASKLTTNTLLRKACAQSTRKLRKPKSTKPSFCATVRAQVRASAAQVPRKCRASAAQGPNPGQGKLDNPQMRPAVKEPPEVVNPSSFRPVTHPKFGLRLTAGGANSSSGSPHPALCGPMGLQPQPCRLLSWAALGQSVCINPCR